jgi:hypothetical protein
MGYFFLMPDSDGDSMQGVWQPLIPRDYEVYDLKVGFYDVNLWYWKFPTPEAISFDERVRT